MEPSLINMVKMFDKLNLRFKNNVFILQMYLTLDLKKNVEVDLVSWKNVSIQFIL